MSRAPACLVLACLLGARLHAEDANQVPLEDAVKRLQAHIATIEAAQKGLQAQFFDHSEEVFRAAFQKHGVSEKEIALRLQAVKGQVPSYLGAVSARQTFYESYVRVLGASLKIVQAAGYGDAEDLAYYDGRMAEWSESEPRLREAIAAMLDADGRRAALSEKVAALFEAHREEEAQAISEEYLPVDDDKSRASTQFTFRMARQYFTGFRNVGDKRRAKERIETAAKEGEILVPMHEAEKRLVTLLVTLSDGLGQIMYTPSFWQSADDGRGRFRRDANANSFLDWCGRNGHSQSKETWRFDDVLQDRMQYDFRYWHHLAVLNSLLNVRKSGVARAKDLEYLESGMKAWEAKAAKLRSADAKIKGHRKEIAAIEKSLDALWEKFQAIESGEARNRFEEEVLDPATRKAEKDEARINERIDDRYDTMFEIAFHVRLFHQAPANPDEEAQAEGADEKDWP